MSTTQPNPDTSDPDYKKLYLEALAESAETHKRLSSALIEKAEAICESSMFYARLAD